MTFLHDDPDRYDLIPYSSGHRIKPTAQADKYVWKSSQSDEFINSYGNYIEALVDIENHRLAGRYEIGLMIEEAYDEHISNPSDSQEDAGGRIIQTGAMHT